MLYYFNELDPTSFQRLINAILVARYGEHHRVTPLRGADGGRDGESAPGNPYLEFQVTGTRSTRGLKGSIEKGRYLFQVKHHRTNDMRGTDARAAVLADFEKELQSNVLTKAGNERVNFFFLITNVSSSKEALDKLDKKRKELLKRRKNLHADIWWEDQVTAFLDNMPFIWFSFPQLFAGGQPPFLAQVAVENSTGLPRAVRIAIDSQYRRDSKVKFQQIDLAKELSKLFVDLNVYPPKIIQRKLVEGYSSIELDDYITEVQLAGDEEIHHYVEQKLPSALHMLLDEEKDITRKIILEGGPGQGKSTITQMAVQIYRQQLLNKEAIDPEGRWSIPSKARLPFRVELRSFGEWIAQPPFKC